LPSVSEDLVKCCELIQDMLYASHAVDMAYPLNKFTITRII